MCEITRYFDRCVCQKNDCKSPRKQRFDVQPPNELRDVTGVSIIIGGHWVDERTKVIKRCETWNYNFMVKGVGKCNDEKGQEILNTSICDSCKLNCKSSFIPK